jgi:hypothetical protein
VHSQCIGNDRLDDVTVRDNRVRHVVTVFRGKTCIPITNGTDDMRRCIAALVFA